MRFLARGVERVALAPCIGFALAAIFVGATACAPASTLAGPGPDAPVPPDAPRATVSYRLDLEPGNACEQHFDLALYADRGIDLIRWDENSDSCRGRVVHIRYLSQKLDVRAVRALVDAHAVQVQELSP